MLHFQFIDLSLHVVSVEREMVLHEGQVPMLVTDNLGSEKLAISSCLVNCYALYSHFISGHHP